MEPASTRYRVLLVACGAWLLAACEPTQTARPLAASAPAASSNAATPPPPPATSGGVEQSADTDAEQARKAAEARRLRCRQQPEVCVQSPAAGGPGKDDAAH